MAYVHLRDAPIAESIEPVRGSDPDVALSVLEDDLGFRPERPSATKKLIFFGLSIRYCLGEDLIEPGGTR